MNKFLTKGAMAIVFGGLLVSCHEDIATGSVVAEKLKAYDELFKQEFPNMDANHDWGFGTTTTDEARSLTRAVFREHWDGVHNSTSSSKVPCGVNWTDTVQFTVPSGLVKVDSNTKITPGNDYYVPSTFTGKVSFDNNYNGNIYVAGKVTGYEGGNQGNVNIYIYKKASWTSSFTSGTVNFYNNGYLTLDDADLQSSNIKAIYNAGSFKYDGNGSNTNNTTWLYSTGTVELTADYVDFKLICDVHNTIYGKNIKIQNSTPKYVCGINATGKVENVDGPLVTSNVIANEFSFDGNPIYLTQGGHIDVGTLMVPNSDCHVYAVTGSTALVEATNFEFGNKNDFTHTFSDNIYFKVKSGYIKVDNCYAMGHSHYFNTVAEYLEFDGHTADNKTDEYALAKDRINAGNASGSPACGSAWMVGDPDTTTLPIDPDTETTETVVVETTVETYDQVELIEQGRVFCEDLGKIDLNDLDFNDVVFDAYIYKTTPCTHTVVKRDGVVTSDITTEGDASYHAEIVLLAAGGTLPLTVEGREVHSEFGVSTSTIVNTIANDEGSYNNQYLNTNAAVDLGKFSDIRRIADIKIVVKHSDEVLELANNYGEAPQKLCIKKIGIKWAKERQELWGAYDGNDFKRYVEGKQDTFWEGENDQSLLYQCSWDTYADRSTEPTVENYHRTITTNTENGGTTNSGGYQEGGEVLSRKK